LKADKEKTRKENKNVQREAEISVQVHSLNGWKPHLPRAANLGSVRGVNVNVNVKVRPPGSERGEQASKHYTRLIQALVVKLSVLTWAFHSAQIELVPRSISPFTLVSWFVQSLKRQTPMQPGDISLPSSEVDEERGFCFSLCQKSHFSLPNELYNNKDNRLITTKSQIIKSAIKSSIEKSF
jgi:hypothetical protein